MSWKLWSLFPGILFGVLHTSLACSQMALLTCMQPVKQFGDMTQGLSGVFNPEQVKSFCQVTVKALDCAKPEWPQCPNNVQLLWKAMDSGLTFLCTEKLDEFLSYSSCWKQSIVNETAYNCQMMLQEEMRNYQSSAQHLSMYDRKTEGCRVIYKYIACINSIEQYCQKQAVNLLSEMVERMVKPTKNILQCDPKTVLVSHKNPGDEESSLTMAHNEEKHVMSSAHLSVAVSFVTLLTTSLAFAWVCG